MVIKNPNEYQKGKTFVYFVRHGDRKLIPKTPENPYPGISIPGPSLNTKGKKQAREVAKEFAKIKERVDLVYSSSMTRAIETAKEIGKNTRKNVVIVPEFAEIQQDIFKKNIHHKIFWKSYLQYRKAIKVFNKILKENEGKEKVIVIVAHGNLIRLLFGNKLRLSFRQIKKFDYHNCHITLMRFKGKKLDYVHCFNNKKLD